MREFGPTPSRIQPFNGHMRRIFGAGEARNFKFGVWIDPGKSHLMTDKIPPKWVWSGSRVEFLNFKTPYLNSERVKLDTLNSVH